MLRCRLCEELMVGHQKRAMLVGHTKQGAIALSLGRKHVCVVRPWTEAVHYKRIRRSIIQPARPNLHHRQLHMTVRCWSEGDESPERK